MIFLVLFAFLAGVVTILSPCILPVLPIVLSGSVGGGKRKPLGIVAGFVLSFTFFTLALSGIVRATGLSADFLRNFSVVVILVFGLSLFVSRFQVFLESLFSRLANFTPNSQNPNAGFLSGILIGLSLGLIWTPCVGPIIASVITLAATSSVNAAAVLVTFAYSLGTSIPMFVIMLSGRWIFTKVPWLLPNTEKIQKAFGVLMIITALGIFFGLDRKFQTFVLEAFPQYGAGLTKFEDNQTVRNELSKINSSPQSQKGQLKVFGGIDDTNFPQAPDFIAGGQWFNLPAGRQVLSLSELRGKVVLVDFWTYTCINCIRTLPYIKSWHEKYADKGLVIVGVHTPEFEFEKNTQNIQKAIADFKIKYPVVQDNDYATWNAYDNHYWPAKYLIDKNGKIRLTHFGEGNYDETEKMIQDLLKETGADLNNMPVKNEDYKVKTNTQETYLGYARIENFQSNEKINPDREFNYSSPVKLSDNFFSYSGIWNVTSAQAMPQAKASLDFNFDSSEVYLVMRSKNKAQGKVKVFLDGVLVNQKNAGDDVKDGVVTVSDDRLYRLIKLDSEGRHLLHLEFEDSNLELYAFTFG